MQKSTNINKNIRERNPLTGLAQEIVYPLDIYTIF